MCLFYIIVEVDFLQYKVLIEKLFNVLSFWQISQDNLVKYLIYKDIKF